jgi:hypothetical protein
VASAHDQSVDETRRGLGIQAARRRHFVNHWPVPSWSLLQLSGINLAGTYPCSKPNPGVRDGAVGIRLRRPGSGVIAANGCGARRIRGRDFAQADLGWTSGQLRSETALASGAFRRELPLANAFFPVRSSVDVQRPVLRIRVGGLRPS